MTWLYQVLLPGGAQQQSSVGSAVLAADSGSFGHSGPAAGIRRALRLACAPGTFGLTGEAAHFPLSRNLAADGGIFSLNGVHAGLSGAVEQAGASSLDLGIAIGF